MTSSIGLNGGVKFGFIVAALIGAVLLAQYGQRVKSLPPATRQIEVLHVAAWATFLAMGLVGLFAAPSSPVGDPSALLTVGAAFQLFGFVMQWLVPARGGVAVSAHRAADFGVLMSVSFALRLSSTLRFQGYLPVDATGDGCYQLLEGLALAVALVGLLRSGITRWAALRSFGVLAASAGLATQCYGDLDNNVVADRVYACSVYVEVAAWIALAAVPMWHDGRRRFAGSFLVPAVVQAACRATFWICAFKEVRPIHPRLLMAYFPTVVIVAYVAVGALALLMGLLVLLQTPYPEIVAEIGSVLAPKGALTLPPLEAPEGAGCSKFHPGRATFENGVLRVEYVAV